jgi:hypothetical protein
MAHAILPGAVEKTPAKPATLEVTRARANCPELNRAVRLAERQINRTGEVKSLPHPPWARSPDP